jgi:hypothetical protein
MRARAGAGNAAVLLSAVMPLLCSVLLCSALLSSTQPSQTQPSQLLQMGGVGTTAPAYILGTAQDKGFLTLNDHSRASDQYCRASWGWAGESSFFLSIRCGTVQYRLSIVDCRSCRVVVVDVSFTRHTTIPRDHRRRANSAWADCELLSCELLT